MASQNITQHWQVKWLVQNLCGSCIKRTVYALFNVAVRSPPGMTTGILRVDMFRFNCVVTSSPLALNDEPVLRV